jgi:tetratricopeptide (TPR) repeat protein
VKKLTLLCALALVAACSQSLAVRAPVLIPARVPVRAFPEIWVVGGDSPEERYLLDRLAAHLAQDGEREVRRVDADELEPLRQQGAIDASTAVVWLNASFREAARRYWDTAPVHYCGYYGCAVDYQSFVVNALEVTGSVDLTVYEGPTARVLQRETFEQAVTGDHVQAQRDQVLELLGMELESAVDVLKARERFVLYKVDMPEVKRALEQIRKGDWDAGRAELEAAKQKLGGHKKGTQARVWYNLGLARWLAPGEEGLTQSAYEAALRALRQAVALDPKPAYQGAIPELQQARERHAVLEAQRSAAKHNFALRKQLKESAPDQPEGEPRDGPSEDGAGEPSPSGTPAPHTGEQPKDTPPQEPVPESAP